jgi:hypothetical protein
MCRLHAYSGVGELAYTAIRKTEKFAPYNTKMKNPLCKTKKKRSVKEKTAPEN